MVNRSCLPILTILCALVLSSCGTPSGAVISDPATFRTLVQVAPPAAFPDVEAVTVDDEGTMEIFGSGDMGFSSFDRHRIVKIFNSRGHRYANVMIPYATGSQVTDLHVWQVGFVPELYRCPLQVQEPPLSHLVAGHVVQVETAEQLSQEYRQV